jgi:glycosyltransferase involved in cell wall biosynthesis
MLRLRRRARLGRVVSGGVTLVTVNWNSLPYLQALYRAVRRFGPPDLRIIAVDNGSSDGSREWLRATSDIRPVLLPMNVGHAAALDLGFLLAETEFVVALDVDAFPIRDGWLDLVLRPLRGGAEVAGAHLHRDYVHPSFLAMRLARFVLRGYSFRARVRGGRMIWDTGEGISVLEKERVHLIERTSLRGPGDLGSVFGGVLYHNFYATRFGRTDRDRLGPVERDEPARAWAEAVATYLD